MPTRDEALKGRAERMPVPAKHHVLDAPLEAAVSRRHCRRRCSASAVSGARRRSSGSCRASTRPRSATRPGSRRIRPTAKCAAGMTGHNGGRCSSCSIRRRISLRRAAEDVLGEPRSDAGHAAGERRRHAVSLGHLLLRRGAARGGGAHRATTYQRRCRRRATARSPPRSSPAPEFYYAEDYHQQYLSKNPDGYCGLGGTGVSCPTGLTV